ncbi:trafficking protein particle complex subunit 6B isoform X2 [Protopterus annectens]|uniref:trafficking protein particle complex subunit 6B isoform X2 n=1 Tax=Protopterus annectens TaxID=7888 RepID=UPI001CF98255|nr:trafficking protein particle complex subunit 6B isoform X2 [Protopterus annectens]
MKPSSCFCTVRLYHTFTSRLNRRRWFTKDTARFKDELDIMKFICKDFWTSVFRKQIDNLRTNHQGIYVLQDNKFRLLTPMSATKQYLEHAPKYLAFTCGLVRGALSNVGIKSIVTAEVSTMPACIRIIAEF